MISLEEIYAWLNKNNIRCCHTFSGCFLVYLPVIFTTEGWTKRSVTVDRHLPLWAQCHEMAAQLLIDKPPFGYETN